MNERPDQGGRNQGGQDTGHFQLHIDEKDLMTGAYDPAAPRGTGDPYGPGGYSLTTAYTTEEERRREKKEAKKRNRLKARKNKRVFKWVWLCMVLLVSFTVASYLITGANDLLAKGRTAGTTKVEVPENLTSAEELAQILYQQGAIKKPEFFALYCGMKEDMKDFVAGTYQLNTNMDYEDIINTLQGGNDSSEVVTVTFPEGVNVLEVAQILEENEVCTADEFLEAVNSGEYGKYYMIGELTNLRDRYYDLEGYLFPDTYYFYKGEEMVSVVGKLLNNFETKMSDSLKSMIASSGMTMDQVIILASIIQAEAANPADMFNVSAVLHNRLDFGEDYGIYYLECDSTTFYPYRDKDAVPETGAMSFGNFDTYQISGLPAGPICNPGTDAIMAALRPNDGEASSYLYFCHDADGNAYYATNAEDHYYNLIEAGLVEEW